MSDEDPIGVPLLTTGEEWVDKNDIIKLALCWALTLTTSTLLTTIGPLSAGWCCLSCILYFCQFNLIHLPVCVPRAYWTWGYFIAVHCRNISDWGGRIVCTLRMAVPEVRSCGRVLHRVLVPTRGVGVRGIRHDNRRRFLLVRRVLPRRPGTGQ